MKQPNEVGEKLGYPEEMNKGYFLPLTLTGIKGQAIKRMPDGTPHVFGKTGDKNTVMNMLLAVDPESPTITLKLYSTAEDAATDTEGLEITVNCAECEFKTPAAEPYTAEELSSIDAGSHKLGDLVGEDYSIAIDEEAHTITATGELKEITDYQDMFPGESKLTSYYLPVKLLGEDGTTVTSTTLLGNEKTLTFGQTDDPEGTMNLVMAIDPASPTRTLKITPAAVGYAVESTETVYTVNAAGCEFENYVPGEKLTLNVTVPDGDTSYYGKRCEELQEKVAIGDTEITGTLKYATGVQIMLHEPKYQEGNYLALDFSAQPEDAEIQVELQGGEPINPGLNKVDDGYCVFRITDKDAQTIHVVATKDSQKIEKTYGLSHLVLEKPVVLSAVEIPGQNESWKNAKYSDLMSADTAAQLNGNKIDVTGTLYKYDDWDAFGSDLQDKNYLVLTLRAAKQGVAMKFQKINNADAQYVYNDANDLDYDLVIALDNDHKTREFTFYPTVEDKTQNKNGQVFTLDCSNVTFETRTKKQTELSVTAVKIAGQAQSFKGVTYSDLMSADTQAQLDDKTIKITGTLYKYAGDALGANAKDKNCAVVNIAVDREGIEVTRKDNPAFSFAYTGKTADDFIIPLTSEQKTCELVMYPDAAAKTEQKYGVTYTVDASQATFETKTKSEVDG